MASRVRPDAAGDFDDDGYDDLLVGTPYESLGSSVATGNLTEVCGSATGLTASGAQGWDQNRVLGVGSESYDRFGETLAVGVPAEHLGPTSFAGAVVVLYGAFFADGVDDGSAGFWSGATP